MNNNKLVYYHRKFEGHCFIIMAIIILWYVKNYCQYLHAFLIPPSLWMYDVGTLIVPILQTWNTQITGHLA